MESLPHTPRHTLRDNGEKAMQGRASSSNDPPPSLKAALASKLLFARRNVRRIAAIGIPLSLLLFGGLYYFFNIYSATALLMVDPRMDKSAQTPGIVANSSPDANTLDSLVLIAKSDAFLGAIVDSVGLIRDDYFLEKGATEAIMRAAVIEKLRNRLTVARRGATYLIEATATTPSPEVSARIANAAAQKIIDDQGDIRSGTSEKTTQNIESRLSELRDRVAREEKAAADLKAALNVTDAGQGSTLLERRVFELNQQLVLANARKGEAKARLEQLRKAGASSGNNLSPSVQSPVLNALRADYARLTRQSADQATVLGDRHPEVASLRAQLADVRRQIGAELARMIDTARTETLEAEQRETLLGRQLKDTQNESGTLGAQLVKLGELDRAAKADRVVYEELLTRRRVLTETRTVEPNDIRIVSTAVVPSKPVLGKTLMALGAMLLGLLGAVGYALARESVRDTVTTPRQTEKQVGVEVAGLMPLVVNPPRGDAPDLTAWLGDLRAHVEAGAQPRQGVAVLVTSPRHGEGRSTLAANIATYFADTGGRVLLVEADHATASEQDRKVGLVNVLQSGEDLRGAFVKRPGNGYTLLPFGALDTRARMAVSTLMGSVTLRATLKLCRQWFDIVVIDGPPVLEADYARLLARNCDVTAIVAEWDKSTVTDANAALDHLGADHAVVVLNKVDTLRYRWHDPGSASRMSSLSPANEKTG